MTTNLSDFLEQDHIRLDILFEQYQLQRESTEKSKILFESYSQGMQEHIRWEEEYVFAQLEQHPEFHSKLVSLVILSEEHKQILLCLNQIKRCLYSQQLVEAVNFEQELLRLLSMHNMKEDTTLYPVCDRLFSQDEKDHIFKQLNLDSAA